MDKMFELIPEETIPFILDESIETIGKLYYQLGRPEELEKRLDKLVKRNITDDKKYEFASIYYQNLKKTKKAINVLKELVERNPNNSKYIGILISLLEAEKDYQDAVNYLDVWISEHPDDKNVVKRRDELFNKISPPKDTLPME